MSEPRDNTDFREYYLACVRRVKMLLAPDSGLISELLQSKMQTSLNVISQAFKDYRYEDIALSFNGGKDCLVLLELLITVLVDKYGIDSPECSKPIRTVFVTSQNPFPNLLEFVEICQKRYNLAITQIPGPMKSAFQTYLDKGPDTKAILVGTRRNDPHGQYLTHFDPTDHGWPKFMRVHPVIDWKYNEVWEFLLAAEIQYCVLYDLGFTSLGGLHDTHPNPLLRKDDGSYKPAFELNDESQERCGRT